MEKLKTGCKKLCLMAAVLCVAVIAACILPARHVGRAAEAQLQIGEILCPDDSGRYSYTYTNAEQGKRYALLVIPGIYRTPAEIDTDKIPSDLLYIAQKTAGEAGGGTSVRFDPFMPSRMENSTVIITVADASPFIAGYISKDILRAGGYYSDSEMSGLLEDTLTIPKDMSWDDLKKTLPSSCYMEIRSDYMPRGCYAVNLSWRDDGSFDSSKAGKTFRITADISMEPDAPAVLKSLARPFAITVTVQTGQPDKQIFTVRFDTGCGQTVNPQTVAAGALVDEPVEVLVRDGYDFAGWELDGVLWKFEKDMVVRDITLRAKWLKKQGDNDGFYCYIDEGRDYVYTGKAWNPSIVIKDRHMNVLRLNKDYTVKYVDNVNASSERVTAKARVTGKGNYAGTVEASFRILPKDIADTGDVQMALNRYNPYKQAGYTPVPSGKYNGRQLKNNIDFTVSCQKLENPGDMSGTKVTGGVVRESGWYIVTVEGKGNYTGKRDFRFEIAPDGVRDLAKATLRLAGAASKMPYTGNPVKVNGSLTLAIGKTKLKEGVDYTVDYRGDNVSVGKKQAVVRALPTSTLCYGEKTFGYEITGLSMKQASISLKEKSVAYRGAPVSDNLAGVTLRLDRNKAQMINAYHNTSLPDSGTYTLQENVDYTVSYRKNKNAGKATVTLVGKGLFAGRAEAAFTIARVDLNDGRITAELMESAVEQDKSGASAAVNIVYTENGQRIALREGTDYTVQYAGNRAAGANAKAVIKGKGNYKGSLTKLFTIAKKELSAPDIRVFVVNPVKSAQKAGYVYKPKVMVYDGSALLKENADYTVDYDGCVTQQDVGSGKTDGQVVICERAGGSYSGMRTESYQVQTYSVADKKCTVAVADQAYTGSPVVFDLGREQDRGAFTAKMTQNGQTVELVPGQDFEIVGYERNVQCGTARLVMRGMGRFGGTRTVSFKIVQHKLSGT